MCVCVTRQNLYGAGQPERYPRTTKEGPEGSQRTAAQDQGVDGDSTAACLKTRAAAIKGPPAPPPEGRAEGAAVGRAIGRHPRYPILSSLGR